MFNDINGLLAVVVAIMAVMRQVHSKQQGKSLICMWVGLAPAIVVDMGGSGLVKLGENAPHPRTGSDADHPPR